MTRLQCMIAFVTAAVLFGCSDAESGGASGDAGRDGSTSRDARADRRLIEAGSRDSTSRDGTSEDVRPGDAAKHVADAKKDAKKDAKTPGATTISISPLTLVPPFSTAIHDYYVRCAAGTNTLTVTMTAASGSAIALVQPTTTPASTHETKTVAVTENEAIVVGLTTGSTTDQYWVRCLPHDFPKLQMTPHPDAGTPTAGYYLIGDILPPVGEGGYAMAVDGNGVPVWYHTVKDALGAVDVDNILSGTISFAPAFQGTFGSVSGQFELHNLVAGTTSYLESSGIPLDGHELRQLSNGDFVLFAQPILTGVNLTGLGSFGANEDMIDCVIQEVSPTANGGAEVWQWDAIDHFDPVQDSTYPETRPVSGTAVVDPFRCVSVDVDSNGDLLVAARNMDSIFLVSRATGAVLWKMGGSTYTKDGAPYIAVDESDDGFYRQHDARFLPDGEISMFDDETGKTPGQPRAVIYKYDVAAGTATRAWQCQAPVATKANSEGSFRILADGSRVIGWGLGGTTDLVFSEVDVNGNDLLDFAFLDQNASYRAVKIPTTAFDIGVLRASAGIN